MSKSSFLQNREERKEENTHPGDASSQLNMKKGFWHNYTKLTETFITAF